MDSFERALDRLERNGLEQPDDIDTQGGSDILDQEFSELLEDLDRGEVNIAQVKRRIIDCLEESKEELQAKTEEIIEEVTDHYQATFEDAISDLQSEYDDIQDKGIIELVMDNETRLRSWSGVVEDVRGSIERLRDAMDEWNGIELEIVRDIDDPDYLEIKDEYGNQLGDFRLSHIDQDGLTLTIANRCKWTEEAIVPAGSEIHETVNNDTSELEDLDYFLDELYDRI